MSIKKVATILITLFIHMPVWSSEVPPEGELLEYCSEDGQCYKSLRPPSSLPEGFSREPECKKYTMCVEKDLHLIHSEFLKIKEIALEGLVETEILNMKLNRVMSGVYLIKIFSNARGGESGYGYGRHLLIEKTNTRFNVLRKADWVE